MKKITFILGAFVFSTSTFASQLVYQPINPSFGGNPMNGSMLMSKAQAQNKHKESMDLVNTLLDIPEFYSSFGSERYLYELYQKSSIYP